MDENISTVCSLLLLLHVVTTALVVLPATKTTAVFLNYSMANIKANLSLFLQSDLQFSYEKLSRADMLMANRN